MNIFETVFNNLFTIFAYTYRFLFDFYGWVIFLIGIMYMFWRIYILEIQHQYVHSNPVIYLHVRVPKDNLVSTLAVETIFAQLHSLHVAKTFAEKFVEGHIQLWYCLEIISMGGKISFVIRAPLRTRHNVEAAIYAHYPQAEIVEIEDYMQNFHYDPDDPNEPNEIFGTEFKLVQEDVLPIKTYKDFEHPAAEEKVIDPLANFFEGMSKMEAYEFFGVQITIQPLADEEWKPRGEELVKKLIGAEIEHKASITGALMKPVDAFSKFSYKESVFGSHHAHAEETQKAKTNWLNMTEGEKERVTLIEKKISKPGYKTKIRFLYIAPKDKFDVTKKSILTGAYRPLANPMINKLKPDTSTTWTSVDYVFSKTLEGPYLEWLLKYKKKNIFKGYKNRDIHIGISMFVLNIEEIATLFHFPITTKSTTVSSHIERTASKKSQPPVDLPILE